MFCHHFKVLPTDPAYKSLSMLQKVALMTYFQKDREDLFKSIGLVMKHLLSAINPLAAKSLLGDDPDSDIDGEEVDDYGEGVNAFYEDDVARSDNTNGYYKPNEERMRLYREHMAKLEKNDPSAHIIGNPSKSFRPPEEG